MKLENKIVVVTGGGNGIGREVVLQALQRGARVAAADIRSESLDETVALAKVGNRLSHHVVNVADRQRVEELVSEVVAHHGAVDGILNVAGIIQPFVHVNDLDYPSIHRVIDVNLYGTIHMVKAFLPRLLERPEAYVANVSSMGGFLPVPGQVIYGASKAAVKLMTEGLYAELLDTHVGVSVILPGAVGTEITKHSGVTMRIDDESATKHKTTSPADAARIILDGIEEGRLYIPVGADARWMNIAVRLAPKRAIRLIQRQMKRLL